MKLLWTIRTVIATLIASTLLPAQTGDAPAYEEVCAAGESVRSGVDAANEKAKDAAEQVYQEVTGRPAPDRAPAAQAGTDAAAQNGAQSWESWGEATGESWESWGESIGSGWESWGESVGDYFDRRFDF